MSEQPPKDASRAAPDAPTELDLSEESGAGAPNANSESETVELKQASLERADGDEAGPKPQRTAETYLGFIIDARFHVESVIATGGMGVVYKARHRVIDKPVAIKVLRPELVDNRDITERFLTEAQAASSVGNEHIVDVTDYGELPDGATYIVMEYLEGESLGRRLKRDSDPLLVSEVESIGRQLAEGLHQAHEAQIIHRDLKPDNVFLVTRGKASNFVKILDFGIAKVQSSQNQATRAGKIFGTPHYMSPEQARGEPLDRRSDIYAFGVMLYQMLAGRLPFDGENPLGILTQHMYVEPTPLCDVCDEKVPPGLEAVVLKCMSKNPEDRYETLESVEADLLRLRGGQLPIAVGDLLQRKSSPQSLKKRLRRAARKRPRLLLPALVFLGASAAAWGAYKTWPEMLTLVAPGVAPTATSTARSAPRPRLTTVALVLSPIDAHVFHGKKDLGAMPLNVRIREGQKLQLDVRRKGYVSQRISIDGTRARAQVELLPIPGTSPPSDFAVPDGPAETRVISIEDGGVQAIFPPSKPAGPPPIWRDAGPALPGPVPAVGTTEEADPGEVAAPDVSAEPPPKGSKPPVEVRPGAPQNSPEPPVRARPGPPKQRPEPPERSPNPPAPPNPDRPVQSGPEPEPTTRDKPPPGPPPQQ